MRNLAFPFKHLLLFLCAFMHVCMHSQEITAHQSVSIDTAILLRNQAIIPISDLDKKDIALLTISNERGIMKAFGKMAANYCPIQQISSLGPENTWDLLIVGIDAENVSIKEWEEVSALLPNLNNYILVLFGSEETLTKYASLEKSPALLLVNSNSRQAQEEAAQILFGAIGANGKLSQAISPHFRVGDGIETKGGLRLGYGNATEVGWDSERLARRLDSIVEKGINEEAFPGCQLLVAKDGMVVFHKAYGYHTYEQKQPVQLDDLYDFASVTKVTGPLPALMKLHGEGKFGLDVPLANYWSDFNRKDKQDLKIREILAHQSRLKPYIVYWQHTIRKNGRFKGRTFENEPSEKYPIAVSPDLYLHNKYRKKIYKAIRKSPLNENPGYVYSGLSFLLFPQIIENISDVTFNEYVQNNFYRPLGAHTLGYNPYKRFAKERLVPTEVDTIFRKRLVHGWVHDEAAAMFDGVSGNAGLFGSANDLAKLMQMYMNMGTYGGKRYIDENTLKEFTRYQFPEQDNRRGLGFDKPPLENKEQGYVAIDASDRSFGHSGFTGTFTWADPEHDLLLIFFSNRVYPTRASRKLYGLNIRPSLHQALYDEIRQNETDYTK